MPLSSRSSRPRSLPLFAALLATVAWSVFVAGCKGNKVADRECTEMLDRYVEMTIAADPALAHLSDDHARAAREMKKAMKKSEKSYRRVHEQCSKEVQRHEYDCAMAAKTANDWEACID